MMFRASTGEEFSELPDAINWARKEVWEGRAEKVSVSEIPWEPSQAETTNVEVYREAGAEQPRVKFL